MCNTSGERRLAPPTPRGEAPTRSGLDVVAQGFPPSMRSGHEHGITERVWHAELTSLHDVGVCRDGRNTIRGVALRKCYARVMVGSRRRGNLVGGGVFRDRGPG